MKRPDIETVLEAVKWEAIHRVPFEVAAVCSYALYLEKLIEDMKDCTPPFPENLPQATAENRT